jgi:hypothetical protein
MAEQMITIVRYTEDKTKDWDNFIVSAKNATFLFRRSYMDYHKDRFVDYSLMVFDDEKLVAILPANQKDSSTVVSHEGLSYGGIITAVNCYSKATLYYFEAILKFLYQQGISIFLFKQIPSFYNVVGSADVEYGLFIANASLYRLDMASVIINNGHAIQYQERRLRNIKKAEKNNIVIKEEDSFAPFWNNILIPNLLNRYGVQPVHSLEEISSLKEANPSNIKQFSAYNGDEIVAGFTIFETPTTAHAQYISANEDGKKNGGIDLLFHKLITHFFKDKMYFDFGIVNEQNGRYLNAGLLEWKEGFGARSFAHRFYSIKTENYIQIEKLLA